MVHCDLLPSDSSPGAGMNAFGRVYLPMMCICLTADRQK